MRVRRTLEHANEPVRVRLTDIRVPVTSERDGVWDSPWREVRRWRDGKMWRRQASAQRTLMVMNWISW